MFAQSIVKWAESGGGYLFAGDREIEEDRQDRPQYMDVVGERVDVLYCKSIITSIERGHERILNPEKRVTEGKKYKHDKICKNHGRSI